MVGDEPEEFAASEEPSIEIIREALQAAGATEPPEAAEIKVVEIGSGRFDDGGPLDREGQMQAGPTSIIGSLTETVVSAGIAGLRTVAKTSGRLAHLIVESPMGRMASDVAAGITAAVAEDSGLDWELAGRRAEERLSRVIAVVVPVVAESIDPATIVERIDVNALMEQVDVDRLLGRIDVNQLLDRVDVDRLLDRVDVTELLDRVDVDALFARADVDALLSRVDIDALLERVDIDAVMKRVEVGNVLSRGTGEVAGSALDLARRQGVGLDVVLSRTVNRLIGRDPDRMPIGPRQLAPDEDGGSEAGPS